MVAPVWSRHCRSARWDRSACRDRWKIPARSGPGYRRYEPLAAGGANENRFCSRRILFDQGKRQTFNRPYSTVLCTEQSRTSCGTHVRFVKSPIHRGQSWFSRDHPILYMLVDLACDREVVRGDRKLRRFEFARGLFLMCARPGRRMIRSRTPAGPAARYCGPHIASCRHRSRVHARPERANRCLPEHGVAGAPEAGSVRRCDVSSSKAIHALASNR